MRDGETETERQRDKDKEKNRERKMVTQSVISTFHQIHD